MSAANIHPVTFTASSLPTSNYSMVAAFHVLDNSLSHSLAVIV